MTYSSFKVCFKSVLKRTFWHPTPFGWWINLFFPILAQGFCRIGRSKIISMGLCKDKSTEWVGRCHFRTLCNSFELVKTEDRRGKTKQPCKGDEFEILIFEGKRQNAGICRSHQKMFATWTFGSKKNFRIYDFQSSESFQGAFTLSVFSSSRR